MSIQSLSSASCSVYSAPRAENLRRPQHAERDESGRGCGEPPRPERRHGGMGALFDALSEELRALARPAAEPKPAEAAAGTKPVATDARPVADTPAADKTEPAKEARDCACVDEAKEKKEKQPDLRTALKDFTEALFDSLRELAGDSGRGHGCHGRGHGWGRGGMSSLADRIEALAQKLAAGAAPAAPTTPAPSPSPAPQPPAVTPAPQAPVATTEVAATVAAPAAQPVSDTIQVDPTPLVAKAEPSDLEESFASLWKALDPDRLKKEEGGSLSELLAFLRRMADRLDGDHPGKGGTGQLVDTVARRCRSGRARLHLAGRHLRQHVELQQFFHRRVGPLQPQAQRQRAAERQPGRTDQPGPQAGAADQRAHGAAAFGLRRRTVVTAAPLRQHALVQRREFGVVGRQCGAQLLLQQGVVGVVLRIHEAPPSRCARSACRARCSSWCAALGSSSRLRAMSATEASA